MPTNFTTAQKHEKDPGHGAWNLLTDASPFLLGTLLALLLAWSGFL